MRRLESTSRGHGLLGVSGVLGAFKLAPPPPAAAASVLEPQPQPRPPSPPPAQQPPSPPARPGSIGLVDYGDSDDDTGGGGKADST